MVIFDWSDAAIAKPFVDVMTWATWLPHDAERPRRAVAVVRRGVGGRAPAGDVAGAATDARGVAGAYHVVSYAGIVRSLDRLRRPEHGGGMTEFFRFLDSRHLRRRRVSAGLSRRVRGCSCPTRRRGGPSTAAPASRS